MPEEEAARSASGAKVAADPRVEELRGQVEKLKASLVRQKDIERENERKLKAETEKARAQPWRRRGECGA